MTDNNAASPGGAMGHYLHIHDDYDEIRLALVSSPRQARHGTPEPARLSKARTTKEEENDAL